jgi:hypothetical protein
MKPINSLSINVNPCQVLFPGDTITIESRNKLDRESVQGSVSIPGQVGMIKFSKDQRKADWYPEKKMKNGWQMLKIGELTTGKGEKIEVNCEIPFFVTNSKAKIPGNLSVESIVRLKINSSSTSRLPADAEVKGKFIEIMKASDKKNGKPFELAFNEKGTRVNHKTILAEMAKNQVKKYGKLHPALYNQFAKEDKQLPVAIWIAANEDLPVINRLRLKPYQMPKQTFSYKKKMTELTYQFSGLLKEKLGKREIISDPLAPLVYTQLTKKECLELAKHKQVEGFFLSETKGIDDLTDSMAIANTDDVHTLGYTGTGIRVAVWENGPDDTDDLVITSFYDPDENNTSDHARHTHGIIKNKESGQPHGHAKRCKLYSANDKSLAALRWAVREKNCTVISQSFHRDSEPESSALSFDDIYKDWLALQWPYPTILQAAGNYWDGDPDNIDPPESEYVNHKGYNSLAIGNHNDDASAMSGSSVFKNPDTMHSDRELPELSANGTFVTAVGLTKSGTSMAAPAAAGCTALIQQANNTLIHWPEGCRAILLAGAKKNITGNTWWQDVAADVDAIDGSGAVDALESIRIAESRKTRNSSGSRRGWDTGLLRSADFGNGGLSTFNYKIKLPDSSFFRSWHVKAALAWNSKVTTLFNIFPISSRLTLDLDLKIFDSRGNMVGYSGSYDNSYEIAEFRGVPGETYTIRIRKWSGNDDTWYGIAWTAIPQSLVIREIGN